MKRFWKLLTRQHEGYRKPEPEYPHVALSIHKVDRQPPNVLPLTLGGGSGFVVHIPYDNDHHDVSLFFDTYDGLITWLDQVRADVDAGGTHLRKKKEG